MTAPTTTPSDRAFWEALLLLHGHRCPMSILGARLGLAAVEALGGRTDRRFSARYFHETCAVDGVQLATGCTLGNHNLQVEAKGEHRLLVWDPQTRDQVRVGLTEAALEAGRRYGEMRKSREALPPASPDRAALEARMDDVLKQLEAAPTPSLVSVDPIGG